MKGKSVSLLLGTLMLAAAQTVSAVECMAESGLRRTALLELYTSEGCSSCPPADRWLSGLADSGLIGTRIVPLALHVDYWDYIGWRDRFAQPGFAARQRELALLGASTLVYTPQVVLNGRDYRGWRSAGRFERDLAAIHSAPAQASIRLTLRRPKPETVEVAADIRASQAGKHVFYLALYENDLTTAVARGENAGATLHHDFVVREWLGPFGLNGTADMPWQRQLGLSPEWKQAALGVAAFVQNTATGEVLQAVSLPLCSEKAR